ncbi:MAG: energy-coupled thiamine transporter ThiT [Clostridia bacterium]|nr:energy-coupled thiamine transporter ThiT [Clostridia bacterium]
MNTSQKTKRLTVSAIMLATAVILALISSPIPPLPFGGSFTIASMLPIVLIAYMYGTKWGLFSAFTYSVIQIIMDLMLGKGSTLLAYFLPNSEDFMGFGVAIGILLLDYFVAYTVLGLGGVLRNKMHKVPAIILGVIIALGARYAVHIVSGYLFFGSWAEWFFSQEGFYAIGEVILNAFSGQMLAIVYSIFYNGLYMIPEIVITAICASGVAWIPYIKNYDVKS